MYKQLGSSLDLSSCGLHLFGYIKASQPDHFFRSGGLAHNHNKCAEVLRHIAGIPHFAPKFLFTASILIPTVPCYVTMSSFLNTFPMS